MNEKIHSESIKRCVSVCYFHLSDISSAHMAPIRAPVRKAERKELDVRVSEKELRVSTCLMACAVSNVHRTSCSSCSEATSGLRLPTSRPRPVSRLFVVSPAYYPNQSALFI
jgi:hypothetical protein